MVRVMYYQRHARAIDAPSPFSDVVKEFLYVPTLRTLLCVNNDVLSEPTHSLLVDDDDLKEARTVYEGKRRKGKVRYRNVAFFEYEKSDIQKLLLNLEELDTLEQSVAANLETLVKTAKHSAAKNSK